LKIAANNEIGFYIFLGIDLALDERIGHAERIRDLMCRYAIAHAVYDKRSGDVGVLVIFHIDHVELSGTQIIGEPLCEPHLAGTIQNIDLNALAFSNEHIGAINFSAHGMRQNGADDKLPHERYHNNSDQCNERPRNNLQRMLFEAFALGLGAEELFKKRLVGQRLRAKALVDLYTSSGSKPWAR